MLTVVLCLIALLVGGVLLIFLSCHDCAHDEAVGGFGLAMTMVAAAGLLICVLVGYDWHKAGVQAEVLNAQFGTKYTQRQLFYADDVIEEIREMKRTRAELNGNLLRGEKEE